jgi:hypothetical protein
MTPASQSLGNTGKYCVSGLCKKDIYPGKHYANVFGGMTPGVAKLSIDPNNQTLLNIRRFETIEEAQAYSDENNALGDGGLWTTTVELF